MENVNSCWRLAPPPRRTPFHRSEDLNGSAILSSSGFRELVSQNPPAIIAAQIQDLVQNGPKIAHLSSGIKWLSARDLKPFKYSRLKSNSIQFRSIPFGCQFNGSRIKEILNSFRFPLLLNCQSINSSCNHEVEQHWRSWENPIALNTNNYVFWF